jgi:hypothetical protein
MHTSTSFGRQELAGQYRCQNSLSCYSIVYRFLLLTQSRCTRLSQRIWLVSGARFGTCLGTCIFESNCECITVFYPNVDHSFTSLAVQLYLYRWAGSYLLWLWYKWTECAKKEWKRRFFKDSSPKKSAKTIEIIVQMNQKYVQQILRKNLVDRC